MGPNSCRNRRTAAAYRESAAVSFLGAPSIQPSAQPVDDRDIAEERQPAHDFGPQGSTLLLTPSHLRPVPAGTGAQDAPGLHRSLDGRDDTYDPSGDGTPEWRQRCYEEH